MKIVFVIGMNVLVNVQVAKQYKVAVNVSSKGLERIQRIRTMTFLLSEIGGIHIVGGKSVDKKYCYQLKKKGQAFPNANVVKKYLVF